MTKSVDEYLKEPYSRIIIPDETSYFAEIMEFPGCFAEGSTADEAYRNLESVAKSWIETSLERNQDIPEPFINQGFGGKVALRLPRSLHRQAVRMAELDGISLNQFLISAIAARVGAEDFVNRLVQKYERQIQMATERIISVYMIQFTTSRAENSRNFQRPENYLSYPLSTAPTSNKIMEVKNA